MKTAKELELSLLLKESHIQQLNLRVNNLSSTIDKLLQRIDEAIEYIEEKTYNPSQTINDDRLEINPKELLDILKGVDKE